MLTWHPAGDVHVHEHAHMGHLLARRVVKSLLASETVSYFPCFSCFFVSLNEKGPCFPCFRCFFKQERPLFSLFLFSLYTKRAQGPFFITSPIQSQGLKENRVCFQPMKTEPANRTKFEITLVSFEFIVRIVNHLSSRWRGK